MKLRQRGFAKYLRMLITALLTKGMRDGKSFFQRTKRNAIAVWI